MPAHTWRHSPWPIIVKCFRERCRPGMLLAWSLVVLCLTAAVCSGTYLAQTENMEATAAQAARAMIIPVIVIQAVILMFLGTGAVAFGIAGERESGVLDYQRMTPMSTPAKLIGYLIGLPIREYILFALTLPFMLFAVVRGDFGLPIVAHFYFIFILSVLVYHLTGLFAGMISPKARRAAVFAQVLVVILYFALPQFSRFGLTFFEFLTIRPALFGLVHNEVVRLNGTDATLFQPGPAFTALDTFRDIPFFSIHLHPTIYTVIVQGVLLCTMWHMVSRRWRADDTPGFSKSGALVFQLALSTLVLGSGWAAIHGGPGPLSQLARVGRELPLEAKLVFTLAYTIVVLAVGMFAFGNASPSPFLTSRGYQKMRKQGRASLGLWRDESTALPLAILTVLITIASAAVLYASFRIDGDVARWPAPLWSLLFALTIAGATLFSHGVCERCATRDRLVAIFIVWIVPVLVVAVLAAADARPRFPAFAATPFPIAAAVVTAEQALSTVTNTATDAPIEWLRHEPELRALYPALPITAAALQIALGIGAQTINIRDRARRRRLALGTDVPAPTAHAPAGAPRVNPAAV